MTQISVHEARLFAAIMDGRSEWATAKDLATKAKIAGRTSRMHCARFVRLGILEVAEVFPGHRYRLSGKASREERACYQGALLGACKVFGIDIQTTT